MGPFSLIYQECQIRKIYSKFSFNALLLLAHATPRREEMMFNSFHAGKHHMYVQQQRAEAAHAHALVADRRPNRTTDATIRPPKKTHLETK